MAIERTCEHCNRNFRVTREREAARKYCSPACRKAHEIEHGRVAAQIVPVEFTCRECFKPFTMARSNVTAYHKKFSKAPQYCSITCSAIGRRKNADEKHKANCKNCSKEFYKTRRKGSGTIYSQQELCSKQCKNEWTSKLHRERNGIPEISRRIKRNYVVLRIPARDGKPAYEILEHRYNMQQHIGRELLPEETVHHVNGDRFNNDLVNLELFSSNHGPGQRVVDKIQFIIEMAKTYPEFLRTAGYELYPVRHISDDSENLVAPEPPSGP